MNMNSISRLAATQDLTLSLPTSDRNVSWASSLAVRRVMQGNKSRDTKPELALRRALHAMGLRYRVASPPLPSIRRTADIVFRKAKVAVFMDGCFWHGCPEHHRHPKLNSSYWREKVRLNMARDEHTSTLLRGAGWIVLRFWSHADIDAAARQTARVVGAQRRKARRLEFKSKKRSVGVSKSI